MQLKMAVGIPVGRHYCMSSHAPQSDLKLIMHSVVLQFNMCGYMIVYIQQVQSKRWLVLVPERLEYCIDLVEVSHIGELQCACLSHRCCCGCSKIILFRMIYHDYASGSIFKWCSTDIWINCVFTLYQQWYTLLVFFRIYNFLKLHAP